MKTTPPRSLAFSPSSRIATSKAFFFWCLSHPPNWTLKRFFTASSTSHLTDIYVFNEILVYSHSGPQAAPESLIWPCLYEKIARLCPAR